MRQQPRIAVRALVAHALRSGDLSLEPWAGGSFTEAILGHQKVQRSRGEAHRPEVPVSTTIAANGLSLEVHGRIDGVLDGEDGAESVVEEIKTTRRDLDERVADESAAHWGQLRAYACLYAEEHDLDFVRARLTYLHLDSGRTREIDRRFSRVELAAFFDTLVDRFLSWARARSAWSELRDASIRSCPFPFEAYRPGQRAMAVAAYRALHEGGQLLVEAPTGIGKTQAVLFSAVKALGDGATESLVYLTARTTGRRLAEGALDELRGRGLRLKSITMTAKEKICFNPEKACTGEECSYARGFYDRLEVALEESQSTDAFTRETVEATARRHHVCPYALSIELAPWMDVVIGDFNHAFDPRAYLRALFDDARGRTSLLVDEAHHLAERARDMFSADLTKSDFASLARALGGDAERRLGPVLKHLHRWFLEARRRLPEEEPSLTEARAPVAIASILERFVRDASSLLAAAATVGLDPATRAALRERLFESIAFSRALESFDDTYVSCYEARGRDVRIKLFCMDPASRLGERYARSHGTVLFSATLAPFDEAREGLGVAPDARALRFPSPFPPENLLVVIADHVSTTYRRRDASRPALTSLLSAFVRRRTGNYLAYFPSYEYLTRVREGFDCRGLEVIEQRPGMTEAEREAFLARFAPGRDATVVGFAVLGGFFGEAIDLRGDRLSGVAIVGLGLPALSPEREEIRRRHDVGRNGTASGFELAYVRPGMRRVLQGAGRLIRSEADRGALLLVDERFSERRYRGLLPREWTPSFVRSTAELERALDAFWVEAAAG